MAKGKSLEKMSYEEAFQEMEGIVERLEGGNLPLEESLDLYERGQALGVHCSELLEKAELKLTSLAPDETGTYTEVDFEFKEE